MLPRDHISFSDLNSLRLNYIAYYTSTARLNRNTLAKIISNFFQLENFADKTTSSSHSFNKINDFVTTQSIIKCLCPYLV